MMAALACLAPLLLLLQVTQGIIIDPDIITFKHCCYGDVTFQHGEVVLSLQRACLQLVCDDGKVVRRYLGDPGQRECCEFDGQLYAEGDELTSHCMTLQCRDSCWHPQPTIADCCSRCSLYDDPHFHTFDDHHYDFHGVCNYSLAQRGYARYPDLGVYADFTSCYGPPSCVDRFTFVNDPHTVISMSNGAIFDVEVNGHPFHVTAGKVHALTSGEHCHPVLAWRSPWDAETPSCLTLFGSSRLILHHCPRRLDIIAHPSHTDELNGLCGHFNFDKDDDFTSRSGNVHPLSNLPLAFPTSWTTADQSDPVCQAPCRGCHFDQTSDPCTASPDERRNYYYRCNDTLYDILKDLPKLAYHVDDCAFDLCMISAYGREEELQSWLDRVVEIVKMAIWLYRHTEGNGDYIPPPPVDYGTTAAPAPYK